MAVLVMVGSVVAVVLLKVGVVLVAGRVRLPETVGCKGGVTIHLTSALQAKFPSRFHFQ